MILSLAVFDYPYWWDTRRLVMLWAQFALSVVETGVMLSLVVVCSAARRSAAAAAAAEEDHEGRIQI